MKNGVRRIMAIAICLLILVSAAGCKQQEDAPLPSAGQWISGVIASAPADPGFAAEQATNNSGMSGTAGRTHAHSTVEQAMWRWTAAGEEQVLIEFDLGQVMPLGEMWIWNYNAVDQEGVSLAHRGLKEVRIYHSTDQVGWQEWKGEGYPFRFASAKGSSSQQATNLDDGKHSPIRFAGTPIRYIRVAADVMPGKGNWAPEETGEKIFGLSEVRFFRHALQLKEGGMIIPISASLAEHPTKASQLEHIVNHYGMSGFHGGITDTHGNDKRTMWLSMSQASSSPASGKLPSLTIDLGGTYPLQEMRVWNYNEPGQEAYGLKMIRIFYSLDQLKWDELKGEGYPYELAKADGSAQLKATNLNDGKHSPITFDSVLARYVKIVPAADVAGRNWGAADGGFGLSELRFYAAGGIAVEPAPEWEELFSRYDGWSGADGIFSIPLNGYDAAGEANETSTLFLFSDTFAGRVDPLTFQRHQASMLHNSLGLLAGGDPNAAAIEFMWMPEGADVHLFTPKTQAVPKGSWYWLQDGIAIDDHIYIFPLVMVSSAGEPGFNFAIHDVNMIKLPIVDRQPDVNRQEQFETPLYAKLPDGSGAILFGAGIMDHSEQSGAPDPDGYVYVYGYKDIQSGNKQLVAARVKREQFEDFAQWRFWNGEEWSPNILESATLAHGVSPEMSVTPMAAGSMDGQYLLVSEKDTMSGYISISTGDSPVGPFEPLKDVYYTTEIDREKQVFTYNAKAHPHLSRPGELLISYNVNTTDPQGNEMNGDIYRPRWIKLRILE